MKAVARLCLGRDALQVEVRRLGRVSWAAEFPAVKGQSRISVISETLARPELKAVRDVDLLLDCPPLQRRVLNDMPPLSHRALGSMVRLQAHRYFRQNGHPLVTDATWLDRGTDTGSAMACAALEQSAAEELSATIGSAGLRLRTLTTGGDWTGYGLDLRPPELRAEQRRAVWRNTFRFATGVVLLWLVALGAGLARVIRADRRITQELTRLTPPREAVLAARRSLDRAAAMVETIENAERSRWALATELSRLTSALPDSAFLTELQLAADGSAQAIGWARRPLELQPILERSIQMDRVRFNSTTARQAQEAMTWEGFSLQLGARRRQ